MAKLRKNGPLVLAALLALCCAFCVWRVWAVSGLLTSQKAAERWRGQDARAFSQHSFFLPGDQELTRDQLYSFRNDMYQKLKAASFEIDREKGLYTDAWSCQSTVRVSAGRQSGEVQAFAVGGDFFVFHPLRLLSGNYLSPGDVMDDRVLLDRETAWLLFGAVDVAGMSFSINGAPFVVAGVYAHEQDRFSRAAQGEGMFIYMSYDSFARLYPDRAGISCYELVMAEPVKGFAHGAAEEKFPIKRSELVDNSYRFDVDRLYKLLRTGLERSMRKGNAIYPYWENAARAAEDRAVQWFVASAVTGAFPAALLLYSLIRWAARGRRKLEEDILPGAKKKSREFFRAQSRRRWERKHPDEF